MGSRRLKFEFLLPCAALLVAFFGLVWVTAPFIELRGFEVPPEMHGVFDDMAELGDESAIRLKQYSLWLLYLIPVMAAAGLILEPIAWWRSWKVRWLYVACAAAPPIGLGLTAWTFYREDTWMKGFIDIIPIDWLPDPIDVTGPGAWVTGCAMAVMWISVFTPDGRKKTTPQSEPGIGQSNDS